MTLTVAAPRSYQADGIPRGRRREDARYAQPPEDGDAAGVHGALARGRRAGGGTRRRMATSSAPACGGRCPLLNTARGRSI